MIVILYKFSKVYTRFTVGAKFVTCATTSAGLMGTKVNRRYYGTIHTVDNDIYFTTVCNFN